MYFAAGDAPFYFAETTRSLSWLPVLWRADEGFGVNHGFRLWYDYPLQLAVKLFSSAGLPWWWIDKLLWVGVLATALWAPYTFGKYFFKKPYIYLTPLIYIANSYFLLLFSGGQLGVAWAYAYFPFVLIQFIRALDENKKFSLAQATKRGVYLSLLMIFDLRFAYVLLGALTLYFLLTRKVYKIFEILTPLLIVLGTHSFWILPTLLMGGSKVGGLNNDITNPGMLRFLSFADFSHALSFLHPNWPENLFGRVYFLQPEFLIIPILAFSSLLFIRGNRNHLSFITYFALLALVGVFLAKGVQEPFGVIYTWAFTSIPGFVMFRDPTKFYVFIALGYSILIPFVLEQVKNKALLVLFVAFWIFTIRAVFVGGVKGNFSPIQVPQEYVEFKNLLVSDNAPSRTLWIPQREKFAFTSDTHPLLYSDELFPGASVSSVATLSALPDFMSTLKTSGVRYVIVPVDIERRLFLNDYRFDQKQRDELLAALGKTKLVKRADFREIAVFENTDFVMQSELPSGLRFQEQYTRIGLVVTTVTLIISGIILVATRRIPKLQ